MLKTPLLKVCFIVFAICLLVTGKVAAQLETIPTGSKIINMGVMPQTAANGLKPYGLVYQLLVNKIPVKWIINPSKVKDGIDFVHNGVQYKGSAFIITAPNLTPAINTLISQWTAKGVIVNTSVSTFSANVYRTLTIEPRWVIDASQTIIARKYFEQAEIPASAWVYKQPSQLNACDDIFILPHADANWAQHKNLYYWNRDYKGAIWVGCYAASGLENLSGPDIVNPAITVKTNFLMKDPTSGSASAIALEKHKAGSPPFIARNSGHPIMQYVGKSDGAHMSGPEKIYLPVKTGGWRSTTTVSVYDPSQRDVPALSNGEAGIMAFGRAFGDENRGWIMYEAGHHINNTAKPEEVAATRAFLNFSFFNLREKAPSVSISNVSSPVISGQTFSITATPSSQNFNPTYTYEWTSTCGGTFSNSTAATTNFTVPAVASPTACVITCKITDNCGRIAYDSKSFTVLPAPRPPVAVADVTTIPSCTGNSAIVNVLANDQSPDGFPLSTVTLIGAGTQGTFINLGNGNIQYNPNSNFYSGTDQVQYQVCDSRGLCSTSTITVTVNQLDVNGCGPDQYYGPVNTINALRATATAGVPVNKDFSTGDPDGNTGIATTYTSMATGDAIVYYLESALPVNGVVNFYVDATFFTRQFTVEQSADSITWTNSQSFPVNFDDQFSEASARKYNASAGTRYIRVTCTNGTIYLDALQYDIMGCISAAPVAFKDVATTLEDIPVVVNVLANDSDPLNKKLAVTSIITQPLYGKVSINPDNTITYHNFRDQIGTGVDSFRYQVCNTSGLCTFETVRVNIIDDGCSAGMYKPYSLPQTISITPTNDTYISSKSATTNYSTSTSIYVKGKTQDRKRILTSLSLTGLPANAIIDSAVFSLYRANAFNNENISLFRVTRNWTATSATWNKAAIGPNWTTPGGDYDPAAIATANTGNLNGAYVNWQVKSLVQGYLLGTYTNQGIILIRNPENQGVKDIRFNSLEAGTNLPKLTIVYRVPAVCTTIPDHAPLASLDTATTNAITPKTINVVANDYNFNATGLTVSLISATSNKGGILSLSGNNITYAPPTSPVFNGVDTFIYKVCSGALCDTARVFVTVTNAPPTANVDVVTMESNTFTTPNTGSFAVTANDVDPEGSTFTSVITSAPTNGQASFAGNTLNYTPDLNFIGSDTLIYQVTEVTGTGCLKYSDTALVIINVTNRAPVAANDSATINPCEIMVIDVLPNDVDPENGSMTITITSAPSVGTAVLVNNNTQIQYSPPSGVSGVSTSLQYVVCDDANPSLCSSPATLAINIRAVPANMPPIAVYDSFDVNFDAVLYADVLTNDTEPDGEDFRNYVEIVTPPLNGTAVPLEGGVVQYNSNFGYYGVDSFQYRIYDSIDAVSGCIPIAELSATAWAYITIQPGPIANRDDYSTRVNIATTLSIITNDIFGAYGPATGAITIITAPQNGTAGILAGALPDQSDDQLTYTPASGFTGKDSLVYQIMDSRGNLDTAVVYIRVWADTDNDGISDYIDIDDDNDGIPDVIEVCGNGATGFNCAPGGIDPALDNDDDGIVNWKDADYAPINAKGCVFSLDIDADGRPDFLDLDSDNDGITDVVEAYGVDVNGDGRIDNFTDTDADGLSQNVDANNTGAAGSGNGLDFIDLDGDAVPNHLDLDSDNDGIPDIMEAGGADTNNDGRVDGVFTDANLNGIQDALENAAALILTGADTNGDGKADSYPNKNTDQQGKPNPYDLDSDGDGITDALEAGFPGSVSVSNGTVSGALTNGWANSVDVLSSYILVNTDARGNANYRDIDSDDDGISDNIEGQPTATYKVPTGIDSDGDGLDDVYETFVGTYSGEGITPADKDNDGAPDYRDTDTDNDGLSDLNEASKIMTLTQANINIADADGDGLVDQFDLIDVKSISAASVHLNTASDKMGANGIFTGPTPSGANVLLVQTLSTYSDRNWRIINNLTIGNQVWYDFNGNGLKDFGESAIGNAVVNLYADVNGDNNPDGGVILTTTSDAGGNYLFSELSSTRYIVGVVLPAGYTQGNNTATSSDPNNGTDNDNNGVTLSGSEVRSNNLNLLAVNNTLDFGLKGTGSIGDFVFNDINANGIQDMAALGLAGVTVSITYSGGLTLTTTTNSTGNYSFANLAPFTYTITFTTPAGFGPSPASQGADATKDSDPVNGSVSVNIAADQSVTNIDAGFFQATNVGSTVWWDVNRNGIKDAGEPLINGATVKIYIDANNDNVADGAAVATTTTNASGVYAFAGLIPNNYIVGVTLPAGYTMVAANGGDPDNNTDDDNNGVSLVSGEVRSNSITLNGGTEPTSDGDGNNGNLTLDFGLEGTGSIGDLVWNDVNGDGIQAAGEPGLQGVTVTLTYPNGSTITTTSNASGSYSFSALVPGTYTLAFTTPSGYFASPAGQGGNAALNSDAVSGSVSVPLTAGQLKTDIDAGFYLPFNLGNQVWYDFNKNGLFDAGETAISGATVRLYLDANADNNADGAVIATATTDVNGNYQFTNLASAKYIVGVVLPTGYVLGTTIASTSGPDNDVDSDNNGIRTVSGEVRTNNITINETNNTLDVGLIGNGSIGNFVWDDLNGNGIQDGGSETGIQNITVTVTNANGVSFTTITNSSGAYTLSGLAQGTYTVSFSSPAGLFNSPTGMGTSTTDSDPVSGSVSVTLTAGQSRTDIDAGFFDGFDIGNKVWFDINNNGLINAGEAGFAGLTVRLYNDANGNNTPDGAAIATTTTDANGNYLFTLLPPGRYMMGIVLPTGYGPSATTATSADPNNGTDNDNNGVTLIGSELFTNNINVNANTNTLDVGIKGAGSIGNLVFNDLDNDGIQDAGETGMSGVTVTLTIGSNTASTVTDASGNYSFINLVPGAYTIAFTTPSGFMASPALQGANINTDSDPVGGSVTVNVATNQAVNTIDAGFFVPSTIGNTVWYDMNGNGLKDAGEAVINGATVNLYRDANGDNIADGAAIATTTTNASGIYSITNIPIGRYMVGVTAAGYQAGANISGSATPNNNIDNDNNGINTIGSEIRTNSIILNGTNNTLDLGLFGTASIGNFVWEDIDGNGIQDAGSGLVGMSGITVTINNGAGITLTTTTGPTGTYTFSNLAAGNYTVSFTTPSGYFVSPANQGGNAALNSDPVNGSVSVTLAAGQVKTDIDAGFYLPFTLGNLVWYDFNRDAIKDANEPSIVAATVNLYLDANGDNIADGAAIATTTTDASGNYQFTNVASGKHIVGVVLPTGYVLGVSNPGSSNPDNGIDNDNNGVRTVGSEAQTNFISINGSTNTLDIGLIGYATIGNLVFNDVNGNGIQDGEAGIQGVVATITNSLGATLTSTTNSSGSYSFTNLAPGTYTVSFATPSGLFPSPSNVGADDTKDSDPVSGSVSVTLTAGQTNNTVDAGFFLPFTLGNQVFYDFDNNGTLSIGETGVNGAILSLYKDNNSDNLPDGAAIATTTTNASGVYRFDSLYAGNYIVGVVANGYAKGTTTATSNTPNSNTDNDNNGVNIVGSEIRTNFYTVNSSNNTLDFGLTGTGSIGNYTWIDENGNGVQDDSELPLAGVDVKLINSGGLVLTATTNASGLYNFSNVGPGTFTVSFKTPNGYYLTGENQGTDAAKDSDPIESGNNGDVTLILGPGVVADSIDAGYFVPFPLGNLVYFDINNNGVKDANEFGIPGLTVNLYNDKNFDNIPDGGVRRSTTTDAAGAYMFTDLRADGYIVGVVMPAGYVAAATTATSADPNNIVNNDNNGVVLSGSEIRSNNINISIPRYDVDFGLRGTASVGNFVWFDANQNGVQNAGETGLAGALVTLTHSTGTSVSTTSDASGMYNFPGLIPGTYSLTFTTPANHSPSIANVGADDNLDSDPVSGSVTVTLTAGQTRTDVDAAFNQTYILGNTVFYDFNNNGLRDVGETGISGVTVRLYADANSNNAPDNGGAVIATTTTNSTGVYQFVGLSASSYIVGVMLPTGYVMGATVSGSTTPNNYTDNDNNGVTTIAGVPNEVRTNFITLTATSNTLDIGLRGTGSIGNLIWNDISENGTQGISEPGLAGVTVSITYSGGPTLTTTSDANGIYTFTNLAPGNYTLTFTTPFGYYASQGLKGNNTAIDSDPVNGTTSVTLTSGQVRTDVDAGFYLALTVGNNVFYDFNDNGIKDAGETGISGATVRLYRDANQDNIVDGAAMLTTTTDANGNYAFIDLPIDKYIVGVVLPAGYAAGATVATSDNPNNYTDNDNNGVTLVGSEIRSNNIDLQVSQSNLDFGLKGTGSIGDFVWNDLNVNGIQDAGEPGISGATVSLTYSGGPTLTTTTNASGNYMFANLAPKTYTVSFSTPSGFIASPVLQGTTNTDSDPVNGSTSISIAAGQVRTGVDAGFYQSYDLGNLVWYDFNNNGLKDASENGLSGVSVRLYADANGDNVADGAAIATTTTDASGIYQFSNLAGGNYIVGVMVPSGFTIATTGNTTPNDLVDNDNNGVVDLSSEVRTNFITVSAGTGTLDIGLKATGLIGNFVWDDANGNGVQDAGETGISGVVVTLTNSGGTTLTTTTNAGGIYSFANLMAGTYTIAFTTPSGYIASTASQGGNATLDSDPVSGSVSVTLTAGQSKSDVDAGFYIPYTLGNNVWYDFNTNGLKDAGEAGINGATVNLYADANADNIVDGAAITTTTTDATGLYQFTGLTAGRYIVGIVMPSGYTTGTTTATSEYPNDNTDNDNNGVNTVGSEVRTNFITITATNNTIDIGLNGTGSIGDYVWNDVNGNGIQNSGENGLSGVTVSITNSTGLTLTTTTNASGLYTFLNLAPGTYAISFTTPSGFRASPVLQGGDITNDSDPVGGNVSVTLAAGQANAGIDAGYYIPFVLGNQVWYDFNNNGVFDAGETGISGATISLYADANSDNAADGAALATTSTDGSGIYQFSNLAGGNYIVGVELPFGYSKGTDIASSFNPNNYTDNDNNGVNTVGSEVRSNSIALNGVTNTLDFGLKGSGSIGSFVWLDDNGNNVQDAGEAGIAGVTVTLNGNGLSLTTTTDANGHYNFASLIGGSYTINFTTPSVPGAPASLKLLGRVANVGGDLSKDSDPDPATGNVTVVLAAGQINEDVDAGFAKNQDYDKDGIPNITEGNGYDPYGDGDSDGILNYQDQTQINGVPNKPLVWKDANNDGINDWFDIDLDGVLNEFDLDSDNDGIPDIIETRDSRATDANNDGMADGVDSDMDGILSSADVNDNVYASQGLSAQDMDLDGIANFFDLDSDGDGMVDAVEARFGGTVAVSGGIVTGARTNGWANSVKALTTGTLSLRNTDGRGGQDFVDIDSDDDGIPDNVEGQPTFSFKVQADLDTDGDGLTNIYDITTNAFGGNGITPFDFDSDGTPDYMDSDTDSDGAPDINEASGHFDYTQASINSTDTDGDGLVDQYDNVDIRTLVNGNRYLNVSNSNMGPNGNFDGPLPTGSNVKMIRSLPTGDRDFRTAQVLPLQIVHFGGVLNDRMVNLLWKVQNEGEVDHYVVERSIDGRTFTAVGKVKAKGGISNVYTYADDVKALTSTEVYYRIRQINKAGNTYETQIIMFKLDKKLNYDLKVYPNPFRYVVNVKLYSPVKDEAVIRIFDMNGKALIEKKMILKIGENSLSIPEVATMAHGTYLMVVSAKDETWSQKLIKQ